MDNLDLDNVRFRSHVCKALSIPDIPKKAWDRESSFKQGVAVIDTMFQDSFAVCTYDKERDAEPRVTRVFDGMQFTKILAIYPVPSYIDNDVEHWDVDEKSKEAARQLISEAEQEEEIEQESTKAPEHEYFFENITNDDEGAAYIRSYNRSNRIGGRVPTSHEGIVLRLGVIWSELQRKNKQ